jgi:hypothetical protein
MEIDFCAYLADSASRTTPLSGKGMEVRSASGGAALVTRHARGARGDAAKIAAALSEIWASGADLLRNPCGIRLIEPLPRSAKTPDPRVNPGVSANDEDQTS